jgi:hypothetical protein
MPTGVLIRYPTGLPGPTAAPLTPTERRLASEVPGPVQYRGVQRDFHARQRVQFVLTADQARRWQDWWRVDLLRGGLWFAADWPLLYGKTDNVYRFAGPPSWEFIAGGPRGQGMRRVSAVFEVRGRGELPREYMLIVTSRPYPVEAEDALNVSFSLDGLRTQTWPDDEMDIGFSLDGGTLRATLINYGLWPADELDVAFTLDGGNLRSSLVRYQNWPAEELDVAFTLDGGNMRVALIRYQSWPAEEMNITFSLDGGSLT